MNLNTNGFSAAFKHVLRLLGSRAAPEHEGGERTIPANRPAPAMQSWDLLGWPDYPGPAVARLRVESQDFFGSFVNYGVGVFLISKWWEMTWFIY